MTRKTGLAVLLSIIALSAPAWAQQGHQGHHGHHASSESKSDEAPSTKAYREANDKMHADMNVAFTGDADIDFLRGMIPHHQGAIDMAKVVLKHGKDSRIRKLAEDIIKAQEAEIAQMQQWLKEAGAKK